MHSLLDSTEFNARLFHPRRDVTPVPSAAVDSLVDVPGAELHLRWHRPLSDAPTLLLFHGNGETVADYDPMAARFHTCGMNLAIVDYRGYGRSSGVPTLRNLMQDAPVVVAHLLAAGAGPLLVMGRSLGSACAAELYADAHASVIAFVWESGFVDLDALAARRGFAAKSLANEPEATDFDAESKLRRGSRPLLVLHGEKDTLIVPAEAQRAFDAASTRQKTLLLIPGRGHNDLSMHPAYWKAMSAFVGSDAS